MFELYDSEGNSFLIKEAPLESPKLSDVDVQKAIADTTDKNVDGLIIMSVNPNGEWIWCMYNKDGSIADMCGNGAKCVALWLSTKAPQKSGNYSWITNVGKLDAKVEKDFTTWVTWPIETDIDLDVVDELEEIMDGLNERGLAYVASINTGVPHITMLNHESWTNTDRVTLNSSLRNHKYFGKAGTNVTWHSMKTLETVSFERGVEGETLACGTGALAVFLSLESYKGKKLNEESFAFPGGVVKVKRDSKGRLWLGGKPKKIAI